ncbi:hypothetical protein WA026_018418 [Henosepilachna vigintioctopunctata]|uniref:Uncharacterized protein n=1 Tax=Henosepilachna vigintioctopunctata TaxID=420089 RepID=A0AAW1UTB1_9CUCU
MRGQLFNSTFIGMGISVVRRKIVNVKSFSFDNFVTSNPVKLSASIFMDCTKQKPDESQTSYRTVILTKNAPKPVGPYSQAVIFNKTLYLSGVLGMDKNKMELVSGGAGEQARQALKNMGHILKDAGSCYENVIKTTIFLANIDDFKEVNGVYEQFFTKSPPARSTFQVGKLPMGALVEIEAIAGTGDVKHVCCNL